MKTYSDKQLIECPIAKLWGENLGMKPFCDDCYVTNDHEKRTCDEAVDLFVNHEKTECNRYD